MSPLSAGLDGFLLGTSLIVAIGAQNAFVLKQGLKGEFVLPIVLICSLSDAVLIAAGVAGLGTLVQQSPTLLSVVTVGGTIFLFVYGAQSFLRAIRPGTLEPERGSAGKLSAAIAACLAFTFLNPHVYLDTVLLLGGLSGRYAGAARAAYGLGAVLGSFTWFFALGYGARLLQPLFADPRAWRVLDIAIGLVMWWLAARLALSFAGA
jgi:L-lysine exporter family protein LysE/ArgO